jgi:hypothetical protein
LQSKNVIDWKEGEDLRNVFVETIQQMQSSDEARTLRQITIESLSTSWASFLNTNNVLPTHLWNQLLLRYLKIVEDVFIDIGKHMLSTKYTLSLGQLLKIIIPNIKQFLIQMSKSIKTLTITEPKPLMVSTFELIVNFDVPNIVVIGVVIINNHMQTIPMQIGKNIF